MQNIINLFPVLDAPSLHSVDDEPSMFGDFYFMEKEIWNQIKEYEGFYDISSFGKVKSKTRKWKISNDSEIAQNLNKDGYLTVHLSKFGVAKRFMVHRLVCLSFIANPKNKSEVNHKNGIKTDNRLENLEWATSSENKKHAFDTGLQVSKKGILHPKSKLSEKDVLEIRDSNDKIKNISKKYGIGIRQVFAIRSKKYWKHL